MSNNLIFFPFSSPPLPLHLSNPPHKVLKNSNTSKRISSTWCKSHIEVKSIQASRASHLHRDSQGRGRGWWRMALQWKRSRGFGMCCIGRGESIQLFFRYMSVIGALGMGRLWRGWFRDSGGDWGQWEEGGTRDKGKAERAGGVDWKTGVTRGRYRKEGLWGGVLRKLELCWVLRPSRATWKWVSCARGKKWREMVRDSRFHRWKSRLP